MKGNWWGGHRCEEVLVKKSVIENTEWRWEIQVLPLDLHLSFVSLGITAAIFVSQEEI